MFFYTNMNIFITLLDNVNKSRTTAGNLSLKLFSPVTLLLFLQKIKETYLVSR
jgi:hypothetical protein